MNEYLKFIEQTRTVDQSMAQVDTVSSSVPDTDEHDTDTGTYVRMSSLGGPSFAKVTTCIVYKYIFLVSRSIYFQSLEITDGGIKYAFVDQVQVD